MRIGIVTAHRYPTMREVRITKFAESLSKRGHECLVFCPGEIVDAPEDRFDHGRIHRHIPDSTGFVNRIRNLPVPINIGWTSWLSRQFRCHAVDVIIARDLRLTLPAIRAAHLNDIKLILDIAEHYPGMMEIVRKTGFAMRIFRDPRLIAWLEAISARKADAVWTVCEENAERLARHNPHIEVINNYPIANKVVSGEICRHRTYQSAGEPVRIVSFGLINEIRGLDLAIDAFAILSRVLPNIRLVIFGDGPTRTALEGQARALGLADRVEFRGFIPFERRYAAMGEGDIGIIFHRACALTQHTLPNKLFDYMSVGLPVVSTPLRPVSRILEREQCGIILNENPADAAESLRIIILNQAQRRIMGERGRRAAAERYLWEQEEEKFERCLYELAAVDG